ncbi:hypothetical protein [Candidatus Entotheonella palauensis]|uniref:hypothetical protein n=1 Tax=Candidatus Entotheonella palauensis TaxID=93172 RepID=UPI000B800FC7|nr:hypothetical protein [Candidatus Entotheonella palauensis]
MTMQLSLSDELAAYVQSCAKARAISPDQFVSELVTQAIIAEEAFQLEKLVAQIQNMPPNPASIRPAQGSLLEALRAGPDDPHFDQDAWQREWANVEAELKAITRANDITEGRG